MSFEQEKTALGIEFGSTRIKAVLIDDNFTPIASGSFDWENKYENNIWTYDIDDAWAGLQAAYKELAEEVQEKYDVTLTKVGAIGFSGMMHGYLPFDKEGNQLAAFRTWRNTITEEAAEELSELFKFNIPQRWSIAHIYQAILNGEDHVKDVDFFTTLAGYVHWQLTGEKILGIGEASGVFPIDSEKVDYDETMRSQFNELIEKHNFDWKLEDILPEVRTAGEDGGRLTEAGARLIDPSGNLEAGIPMAPPEGDAGTGMAATNSVSPHTGNVSAGTSIFSMIVLDHELSDYYVEIDMVTTPSGQPVAMIHCNNFTSDIDAWVGLIAESMQLMGQEVDMDKLYTTLYKEAMNADPDVGKLVTSNYYSGEPITGFEEGRPLVVRMPDSKLSVANFFRAEIYSALATLRLGHDILSENESVEIEKLVGHGGFFRTAEVGQQIMADALEVPISVMETAGEGGPWGMALLAAYTIGKEDGQSFEDYLEDEVFSKQKTTTLSPANEGTESFQNYMKRYSDMLEVERAAVDHLRD
jgi:sugar (pentulose or hexulose) kinase